jgi:hypothetical protein
MQRDQFWYDYLLSLVGNPIAKEEEWYLLEIFYCDQNYCSTEMELKKIFKVLQLSEKFYVLLRVKSFRNMKNIQRLNRELLSNIFEHLRRLNYS